MKPSFCGTSWRGLFGMLLALNLELLFNFPFGLCPQLSGYIWMKSPGYLGEL